MVILWFIFVRVIFELLLCFAHPLHQNIIPACVGCCLCSTSDWRGILLAYALRPRLFLMQALLRLTFFLRHCVVVGVGFTEIPLTVNVWKSQRWGRVGLKNVLPPAPVWVIICASKHNGRSAPFNRFCFSGFSFNKRQQNIFPEDFSVGWEFQNVPKQKCSAGGKSCKTQSKKQRTKKPLLDWKTNMNTEALTGKNNYDRGAFIKRVAIFSAKNILCGNMLFSRILPGLNSFLKWKRV